jgi:hypothetical protein
MESVESQLCTIDCAIANHEREIADIDATIQERYSTKRRSALELGYLELAALLRKPAARFELWPIGVLLIAPLIFGGACLSFFMFLPVSVSTCWVMTLVIYGLTTAVIAILLFKPPGASLQEHIDFITPIHQERIDSLRELESQSSAIRKKLASLKGMRQSLITSDRYEREQLLKRNWKDLRGVEWEQFLAEVFSALGGNVQTTPISGDQGVDLVVTLGSRRIAIQAKGYLGAVGNDAVQQVVAGRAHYKCNACAVISNSRFTPSALDLAASNGCTLIDELAFAAFALGEKSI